MLVHLHSYPYRVFRTACLAVLVTGLLASAGHAAPSLRIMPPGRSVFFTGQRFDIRVEARDVPSGKSRLAVTVNGTPLYTLPGAKVSYSSSARGRAVMARGVSFDRPMEVEVKAELSHSQGVTSATRRFRVEAIEGAGPRARNLILFIADGLGPAHRTAARIVAYGHDQGKARGFLEMDRMEAHGYAVNTPLNSLVTDSAASASALAGGHKTDNGALCVWPDDTPDPLDNPRYETIAEYVKRAHGMAVGVVSNSTLTDATPAAFLSHSYLRGESEAIASQFLQTGVDVLLGGGADHFMPRGGGGARGDGRNLVKDFRDSGYAYVTNAAELKALPDDTTRCLGLFAPGQMATYVDRAEEKRKGGGSAANQPSLEEMTEAAIRMLSKSPKGFFLMVEGAFTDKQSHGADVHRATWETIQFDRALGIAKRFAEQHGDTLVVSAADHETGGLAIRGSSGNPAALVAGWGSMGEQAGQVVTTKTPLSSRRGASEPPYQPGPGRLPGGAGNNHTGIDIPVAAMGPGAHQLIGPMEQTDIVLYMLKALGGAHAEGDRLARD